MPTGKQTDYQYSHQPFYDKEGNKYPSKKAYDEKMAKKKPKTSPSISSSWIQKEAKRLQRVQGLPPEDALNEARKRWQETHGKQGPFQNGTY